ncbi:non-ribosomal peptide synthetase, partial [Mycobacterium asiaticum]|uniref:non-ribosomal peptide synthetase n=1 Tax=Mycobacterium asiaticum TaxID=1790 RepID=UPI00114ECBCA
ERTTRAVGELARACRTTVNTVLQGAFAQVLMWLTGQQDVVFGITVSGRPAEVVGADSMVGLLINTVPVRVQLSPSMTAVDLLGQLHRVHNDTLEHQHLALTEIHRLSGHDRLFDTLFVYENYPMDLSGLMDGIAVSASSTRDYTHYPLTIRAMPGVELGLRVEFDTAVLDAGRVGVVVDWFIRVLVGMTADPRCRLAVLDLLGAGEHAGLARWGNRAVLNESGTNPNPVSIPLLWAQQVARTPAAVAVVGQGRSMTYRELEESANRLGHLLSGLGVGPGQWVGLLVSRSAAAVVAMLAVLKTGAGYVPIDPGLPDERVDFLVADAAPSAVLTTAGLAGRLAGHSVAVIDIEDPGLRSYPATALPLPSGAEVAYLIYTSGTTGVPKGVAVSQHNVTQLLASMRAKLPAGGVWSHWHSLAFDVSVFEIWGALLSGGRLVIVEESVARSPEDFHTLLATEHVTILSQTPSA